MKKIQNQEVNENIPVDLALELVRGLPLKQSVIEVPVSKAGGKLLADDAIAQRYTPQFDNSAMDGFLFYRNDLNRNQRTFRIVGEIRPEDNAVQKFEPGNCLRIMTGARVPDGDFFVIPVELISAEDDSVTVNEVPDSNPIRRKGEGYKTGKTVLEKGTVMRPYEMGLLIESGNKTCQIYKPVTIALQVTGSEISEDNNTNGPVLTGVMQTWPGVDVSIQPVLDDQPENVRERLRALAQHFDIMITTGGISAGRHDYILNAMLELGANVHIRKVLQKPGKPFTVTTLNNASCFHLPGNPISAIFTAEFYVRAFLYQKFGLNFPERSAITETKLQNSRGSRTIFAPGTIGMNQDGRLTVKSEGFMKSHLLQLYSGNDVYVRLDQETEFNPGEQVPIIPFSTTFLP